MATRKTIKLKTYKESGEMLNSPKGYKRNTDNQPDMKKVKAYYSKKK